MKITKSIIDRIKYDAKEGRRQVTWDEELRGFGVRAYPSGKKSFVLSYRVGRRKRLLTLGQYGSLTLEEGRKLAKIRLGEIASGKDPVGERQEIARQGTVRELCSTFIERHAKVHKKTWPEDKRRLESYVNPKIGALSVRDLTVADVAAVHREIGERSIYEANRTMEVLRCAIELGRDWGFIDRAALNPVKFIKRFAEKKRDRWLTHEELPRVAQAISEEKSEYIRAAIWLYLLTGVRKSELLKLRWDNVDLFRREIRLEDTKNGTTHYVPLSSRALDIIKSLPRLAGNPYVIPGVKKGAHLVGIARPWMRIREKAGVSDVRLHDLRRTLGSWLAQNGASLHLIGTVLNHKSLSTTQIYARFARTNVRDALEGSSVAMLDAVATVDTDAKEA